ncbi:MAG: DnaJ domain-containing protein [Verrucomicrobiota bacterium]|nr:DnaJ domain-containing protein [Verrucomicrobiota bacterium]
MTDSFALLDEPRQPWLEVEALKTKFLARSAATHPDKFTDPTEKKTAQTRFAELNTAHEILRDPKRRLQHLLTLERGRKPDEVHNILSATADLFQQVDQLLRAIAPFLAQREAETSPLLKAQTYPQALDWLDQVTPLQKILNQTLQSLDTQLQSLNQNWNCETLEPLFHQYSYLQKWREQLNDRAMRLGF